MSLCRRITNQLANVYFFQPWDIKYGKRNISFQCSDKAYAGSSWHHRRRRPGDGKLRFSHTQYSLVDATQWCIYRSITPFKWGKRGPEKHERWRTRAQFVREEIQITFRCGSTWLRQEVLSYFTSNEAALFFPVEVNLPLLLSEYSCQQSLLWTSSSGWMHLHVKNQKRTWKIKMKSSFISCQLARKELSTLQAKQT